MANRRTQPFAFSLGDKVNLVEIKRPGVVTAAMLDDSGVQYRVVFWNDCARRTEWVYDHEIELRETTNAQA